MSCDICGINYDKYPVFLGLQKKIKKTNNDNNKEVGSSMIVEYSDLE